MLWNMGEEEVMDVLITGSNGFVGRHLVKSFVDQGHRVTGIYRRNLMFKVEGCNYIKADLSKVELDNKSYDCVIHCAGQVEDSDTWGYVENSIIVTKRLITYCEKNNIPKLIFMSTIAVYGSCEGVVNEESPKTDLNDYALAKLMCENMIKQSKIHHKYIIRLSRIVGDGGFETGGFLTKFSEQMIRNEKINYSNGNILYNNIFYISDLIELCEKLLTDVNKEVLCVGVGANVPVTMKQLVYKMKEVVGSVSELEEVNASARLTCHLIDITKLKELGIKPMSAEETVELMMKDAEKRFRG